MKPINHLIIVVLLFLCPFIITAGDSSINYGEESFLIYYWLFGDELPDSMPLENIPAYYGHFSGGVLHFQSALSGYPFNVFHPNWRKASMEKIISPTPINYRPEGNNNIPYQSSIMSGIQIKQPFEGNNGENTLTFELPSTGFKDLIFRFVAKTNGAANAIKVDYSTEAGNPYWINDGLITNIFPLQDNYMLFEINFTEDMAQSPPPPPAHGIGDVTISAESFMMVDDNPNFKLRIRFVGSDMTINENKNVVFNNFSLEGKVAADDYQVINVPAGWSGISSFINSTSISLEQIFFPVKNNLIILQNFEGFYWPSSGVNTLINWNGRKGYSIKAERPLELLLSGNKHEDLNFILPKGWSYLSVLTPCSQSVVALFNLVANQLIIIKEIAGNRVYWPSLGINNLDNIEPGKSYLVMMQDQENIEFEPCDNNLPNLLFKDDYLTPTDINNINKTPFTHIVAILPMTTKIISVNDVVTIENLDGKVYGESLWEDNSFALTLYGDDPTTPEKDGFTEYEPFIIKIKSSLTDKYYIINPGFDPNHSASSFTNNGLAVIDSYTLSEMEINRPMDKAQIDISPNPATKEFVLTMANIEMMPLKIIIRKIDGALLKSFYSISYTENINIEDLPKGIYLLEAPSLGVIKKFIKL